MKITFLYFSFLSLLFCSCTTDREIITKTDTIIIDPNSELIYYWNFNLDLAEVSEVPPNYTSSTSLVAKITYPGIGGIMDIDSDGYVTNARNNDPAENLLKVRNPSNTKNLVLDLPTTGYNKIVLQFATARSNNGANIQNYTYTIDGTNYTNTGLIKTAHNPKADLTPPLPDVDLVTLDFSSIPAVNNNPNFKVKIEFAGDAATGTTGNNRFDNITLVGVPTALVVVDPNLYLFQYWNFNNLPAGEITAPILPDASLITANTANITYIGTGGILDPVTPGNALNAQNGDAEGFGLRTRNPSNAKELLIKTSSIGYKNIILKFATAKSSAAGASTQNYSYSLDGTTFITTGLAVTTFSLNIEPIYDIVTLDFSKITGANNNPNFTIKISFSGPETLNTTGNNRFDNFTLQGNKL
jgi:hypothetical protein